MNTRSRINLLFYTCKKWSIFNFLKKYVFVLTELWDIYFLKVYHQNILTQQYKLFIIFFSKIITYSKKLDFFKILKNLF